MDPNNNKTQVITPQEKPRRSFALQDPNINKDNEFHVDHPRIPYSDQSADKKDSVKQKDILNFIDMFNFIPQCRKQIPKTDYECVNRLMNEFNRSVQVSTILIIPGTFFGFYNSYFEKRVGRVGKIMLAVSSTAILTVSNLVFFQQVYNSRKIEQMQAICSQYKPLIRKQDNINFVNFIKPIDFYHDLLNNDRVAERAYNIAVEQYEHRMIPGLIDGKQPNFYEQMKKLKMEIQPIIVKQQDNVDTKEK